MKFGSLTYGLGDTLVMTTLCKYFPNQFTIQIPYEKAKFSVLFDHLAKVELCHESDIMPFLEVGHGHYATRKLRGFFGTIADGLDNRPIVLHTNYKSEKWAYDFLRDKPNPIIFAPNCSKEHASVRNIPDESIPSILESFKKANKTPIICQMSSNYRKIEGVELIDLDLKDYICLLRQVGFYAGANTGDEHLATAVGCKTVVYQPRSNKDFEHSEWNYTHASSSYYTWEDEED